MKIGLTLNLFPWWAQLQKAKQGVDTVDYTLVTVEPWEHASLCKVLPQQWKTQLCLSFFN